MGWAARAPRPRGRLRHPRSRRGRWSTEVRSDCSGERQRKAPTEFRDSPAETSTTTPTLLKTYRLFRDGTNGVYRIRIAKRTLPTGAVDLELSSVTFEDLLSGEVFTAPAPGIWHVEQLEEQQMADLLRRAMAEPA